MRILLVSHVAPPHIGGVENVVQMEAEAFRDAGHDVCWITSDANGHGSVVPEGERLRLVRVAAWHLLERRFGVAYPLFAPSLLWHLWRETGRADLVHVHGLVFGASPFAALFARLRGKRVVVTDHGGLLRYPSRLATLLLRLVMATVGRITASCAHELIAYNHDVEALLTRLGGQAKVRFLANPIDVTNFAPPTAAQRVAARAVLGWDAKPRVLCVSRLLPHKIDVLLAAQDPAYEVVFVGPGDPATQQRIRDAGARCLAARPRHELRSLYHAADAFCLPSHNEGFPVAIQEALACGLPVVTSDLPAYAAYRDTPGLHLCEPQPEVVRRELLAVLRDQRQDPRTHIDCGRAQWIGELAACGTDRRDGRLWRLAIALLLLHFVFTAARWPVGTVAKRGAWIADFRRRGEVGWHFRKTDEDTRRIAQWLVENVPADEFVPYRGDAQGALQLLAPALFPRLLVRAQPQPRATDAAGRRAFRAVPPWLPADTRGAPVVVGVGAELRLEFR